MEHRICSYLSNYMTERVKEKCRESGHICPYWVDDKIFSDLEGLDKLDNGDRCKRYLKQCHEPFLTYRPNIQEMKIRCGEHPLNIHGKTKSCDYTNDKVAKEMLEEINFPL